MATVYDGGRVPDAEIGREDGTSAGFVDLEVSEGGALRMVGFSTLVPRAQRVPYPPPGFRLTP